MLIQLGLSPLYRNLTIFLVINANTLLEHKLTFDLLLDFAGTLFLPMSVRVDDLPDVRYHPRRADDHVTQEPPYLKRQQLTHVRFIEFVDELLLVGVGVVVLLSQTLFLPIFFLSEIIDDVILQRRTT